MSRAAPHSARRVGGGDAGFSLVEVIVAVALLGLAVVSVIPAMIGVVRASSRHDRMADAHSWIVSAGDFATSGALPRVECASPSAYQPGVQAGAERFRPDDWAPSQLSVTAVSFWTGSTFTGTCSEAMPSSLQQLTLQVVDADGQVLETLDVVKPAAPYG